MEFGGGVEECHWVVLMYYPMTPADDNAKIRQI